MVSRLYRRNRARARAATQRPRRGADPEDSSLMNRRSPTAPRPLEALEPRVMFAVTPTDPPAVPFHLPARGFRALDVSANDYLAKAEQLARALAAHQDDSG